MEQPDIVHDILILRLGVCLELLAHQALEAGSIVEVGADGLLEQSLRHDSRTI